LRFRVPHWTFLHHCHWFGQPRHVANCERSAKATILVNKVTWSISSLVRIWKICHCVFLSISLSTI
jgi:hypothetical protein